MTPRFLLDTHVILHVLTGDRRRLGRKQARIVDACIARGEAVWLSAHSLVEIAMLLNEPRHRIKANLTDLFREIDDNPVFQILPITTAIAAEAGALLTLRDPADRVIAATARVHRLTLLSSDQRIVSSGLVAVIE